MIFLAYFLMFLWRDASIFAGGMDFNADSFSGFSVLANEGKNHLNSITDKANVSRYGSCWRSAITDLQIGCKSLSEEIQKRLALKLTDCFLQAAGYEPVNCELPKVECLQKLSDRAFNAYTEFYTHTHSICYFLQSQIWQEEAEKTVNKLSSTSNRVSEQLAQSEMIQKILLNQQKESLFLQNDLVESSKGIIINIKSSQENIQNFLKNFETSTYEQRKLLIDVFENLSSFRSWVINEMSWFSSSAFFLGATIMSVIFTSVSRTRGARAYVLLILTLNFFFERILCSVTSNNIESSVDLFIATNTLYSWIWLLRKFSIFLSAIIIIYTAFSYQDYFILNHQLLLEIKKQNAQILKYLNLNNGSLCSHQRNNLKSVRTVTGAQNPFPYTSEDRMFSLNSYSYSNGKQNNLRARNFISSSNNLSFGEPNSDQIDNVSISQMNFNNNGNNNNNNNEEFQGEENAGSISVTGKSVDSKKSVRSVYNLRSQRLSKTLAV